MKNLQELCLAAVFTLVLTTAARVGVCDIFWRNRD
jgi:hypothetical protein